MEYRSEGQLRYYGLSLFYVLYLTPSKVTKEKMRKPICVPGSLLLCTASICPEQCDVEGAGKN